MDILRRKKRKALLSGVFSLFNRGDDGVVSLADLSRQAGGVMSGDASARLMQVNGLHRFFHPRRA
jgi:hypothetical protein